MKTLRNILTLCFATLVVSAPVYASANGEIDFADLSSFYGEPKVEINLSASLMNMIGSFAKSDEPEVAQILSNLESIKVRVYNLNGEVEKANSTIDRVSKELKAAKWETLVTVNDNEENQKVRIFSKSTNDIIDGVVVMVVSPEKESGEAVFINIVGEIDPNKIAKVTETLDIDIN
jgi:seryl-tRNA synthetase